MKREFHPVANIFPLMQGQEFSDLCEDIETHGLRDPICLYSDGRIVDGRNRYLACEQRGIEPEFYDYDGEESELLDYVLSLNLHRRHLTESQRAMVAAEIANLEKGRPIENRSIDLFVEPDEIEVEPVTQKKAADMLSVSVPSLKRAKQVKDKGTPELVEAVKSGKASVSAAVDLLELPPKEQKQVAGKSKVEIAEVVKEVREKKKAHVANNSGNNEWYTPQEFIDSARSCMGGIDLDPASSEIANQTVQAKAFYTKEDNGLTQDWSGRVWMNPPYAQPLISEFAKAVSEKYAKGEVSEACVLVNNATETGWFSTMLCEASAVCFPKGRVKFLDQEGRPSGAPLQGQAILYFGKNRERFKESFQQHGGVLYVANFSGSS